MSNKVAGYKVEFTEREYIEIVKILRKEESLVADQVNTDEDDDLVSQDKFLKDRNHLYEIKTVYDKITQDASPVMVRPKRR